MVRCLMVKLLCRNGKFGRFYQIILWETRFYGDGLSFRANRLDKPFMKILFWTNVDLIQQDYKCSPFWDSNQIKKHLYRNHNKKVFLLTLNKVQPFGQILESGKVRRRHWSWVPTWPSRRARATTRRRLWGCRRWRGAARRSTSFKIQNSISIWFNF